MHVLHIEHAVPTFEAWKFAYDSDPLGRVKHRVRSYRVTRPVDNANYAIIDLLFDTREDAEKLLEGLQELWKGPGGKVMIDPQWRISELIDDVVY
jgi:hypothetical protein